MATTSPHSRTLFHLVPTNTVAKEALSHQDNKRFVSLAKNGLPGLEVGYHVSTFRGGHVITRLGRNADLILREASEEVPMSAVHVAFEINPATNLIVLSVRSKHTSSVTFAILQKKQEKPETASDNNGLEDAVEEIIGDGVIFYAQNYTISIASYKFELLWLDDNEHTLRRMVLYDYEKSLQCLQNVPSRDRPTGVGRSEAQSWHITRLQTAKKGLFQDIPCIRQKIGQGGYGTVFKAVDQSTGNYFAIKVLELNKHAPNIDYARARIYREIQVLESLRHPHIIEFLGSQHFDTPCPEIFMPLREGCLVDLMRKSDIPNYEQVCLDALKHSLSALDYVAHHGIMHRDVKPENILYYESPGIGYQFQLADFGLAHYFAKATTICGTPWYQAPELHPFVSKVNAAQSPKMDVYSLMATLSAMTCRFTGFPPMTNDYSIVLRTLQGRVRNSSLEPMSRLNPDDRASAAQMLVSMFDGWGLTTPRSKIPLLVDRDHLTSSIPPAGPSNSWQPTHKRDRRQQANKLIVYPPHRERRKQQNGVVKHGATSRVPMRLREEPAQQQERAKQREKLKQQKRAKQKERDL